MLKNDMNELSVITTKDVEEKLISLRNQKVLLDCDVADLYGVKTKEINQAVKNNPDKFPYGYIFVLDKYEKAEVVKTFDRLNKYFAVVKIKHKIIRKDEKQNNFGRDF